jgi:hypothetical protein
MRSHHDVHVFPNVLHGGWKVTQGKRVLTSSRSWDNAMALGIRRAKRDQVDLVAHGRNGRIRSKDSYGNESPTRDTEH